VRRHFLRVFERAAVGKVSGDAGRAEGVITDRRVNARGDSVRIPINSPGYSDPISPAIPISNRPGEAVLPAR